MSNKAKRYNEFSQTSDERMLEKQNLKDLRAAS
jgi:hypothetical protein